MLKPNELKSSILREIFSNTDKRKYHSSMSVTGYYNLEDPPQIPLEITYPTYVGVYLTFDEFHIHDRVFCSFRKNFGRTVKHKTIFPIKFRQISFHSEVEIGWIESEYRLTFLKCSFNDLLILIDLDYEEINISECNHIEKIVIKNSNIKRLIISDSKINKINFEDCKIESLSIKNTQVTNCTLNSSFEKIVISSIEKKLIENLSINYSTDIQKSEFILANSQIKHLHINGIKSKDNSLILKDLELNNLEINDFSNEGTLRLHNVQFNKDSIVKIDNSFLGKTELNNVDFSQAKEFYISKSNVLDLITTNTKYPKNRDTYKGENEEDRRELFRQLKTISSKNKEQEQIFEGFELDIQEALTKKWNDKIALFLNRISNSHGQNWILALIFTLLSSLIFFILYVISLQNTFDFRLIFNSKGYQFLNTPILDYFKYYFEFLNPTHRFNFITDDINFASSFWDFLGRTFTGYGIYQLIAAFRKHGKKA